MTKTIGFTTLVPRDALETLTGWERLQTKEQNVVFAETQALAEARRNEGLSKLAQGEHLYKIQTILEPQRIFNNYIQKFGFSKRTAYRYIQAYSSARKFLPDNILQAAMARGMEFLSRSEDKPLGRYSEVVRKLPPPKTDDPAKVTEYLNTVEETFKRNLRRGTGPVASPDPDELLREAFRVVDSRFRKLPNNSRARSNWVRSLIGMMMAQLGVSQQSFEPVAVPEGFRAQRGRPRKKVAAPK